MLGGIYDFIHRWRMRGDTFAQAEGGLLTFIAACCSVLITLIYVYYTRRSLEAAEEATALQREQWEQRISVKPMFWLELEENGLFYLGDPEPARQREFINCQQFFITAWNRGEQSILLTEVTVHLHGGRRSIVPLRSVIEPNAVSAIDVTRAIVNALCVQGAETVQEFVKKMDRSQYGLTITTSYSDWRGDNIEADIYRGIVCATNADRWIDFQVSPAPMKKGGYVERAEDY